MKIDLVEFQTEKTQEFKKRKLQQMFVKMEKFHKNKIEEGTRIFKNIKDNLVSDPLNLSEQCAFITSPKYFMDFAFENNLIVKPMLLHSNSYKIILTSQGRDILNRDNGFKKFYLRHIYRKEKMEAWKYKAQSIWWVPIVISLIALAVSIWF